MTGEKQTLADYAALQHDQIKQMARARRLRRLRWRRARRFVLPGAIGAGLACAIGLAAVWWLWA